MWSRLMLAGVLALLATFGALPVEATANGATVVNGTQVFPGPVPCIQFFDVGYEVCGFSGTVQYHLVFPPNGGENSWFKVENFTGSVQKMGTPAVVPFANASAMIQVHLGPNRPNFILVNHSSVPGVPHRIMLD